MIAAAISIPCLFASLPTQTDIPRPVVHVASKSFTESIILGEIITQLARDAGADAVHQAQLGGTRIAFSALINGEVDVYPEYTGTISEEILAGEGINDEAAMRAALADRNVVMSRPLGFNNTYILGMRESVAERLGVGTISDLRNHPSLRFGFSNEFMDRGDGWPSLRDRYALPQTDVRGLQHDLAYRGLAAGDIDVIDLYATDAEIEYYKLRPLEDDLSHFPAYQAVLLYRGDLASRAPDVVASILRLEGLIDAPTMMAMNARSKLGKVAEASVAGDFVKKALNVSSVAPLESATDRILRHTGEHLVLVGISLSAAILLAIPLGVVAARRARLGQVILAGTGIIQTVPSLALLVFMIPLFGIGGPPAIAALFLYSLLPIVRNTYAGLRGIPPAIRESAEALGLPAWARLWRIELPMASRMMLAGIKTSAVINVGTATLGGFIAAGGYGQLIFTGLTRDDVGMILQGAVPAAVLALIVQGLFDVADRVLVPAGLRLKPQE